MKIIAIGHNYREHNRELDSDNPAEPVVFLKPDTALLLHNRPFYIPDFTGELHYETELLVRINRLGKHIAPPLRPPLLCRGGAWGDFTARDLQRKLRAEGKPWEVCKAFDGSAVVSEFIPLERAGGDIGHIRFRPT